MRLVLDPAEDAAHGKWLRNTPGGYEWWYFDAVSHDGLWSLACIWFLGNPFSPYYRLSACGGAADPYTHNAVFFALHRQGRLHAYHFTRFPPLQVSAEEDRPAHLRFGPNTLTFQDQAYRLRLADENGNRRRLDADLVFQSAPLRGAVPAQEEGIADGETQFWLPAAPSCQVTALITLQEAHNCGAEQIAFTGHGYHDHNWGRLPFDTDIRDWYWARASLPGDRAMILYHVDRRAGPVSHWLLFEAGRLVCQDTQAQVTLSRRRVNAFGQTYATRLAAASGETEAVFHLGTRLDSSPFYIRASCEATLTQAGRTETACGIAEYFRPRLLGARLSASAMKARIVEA